MICIHSGRFHSNLPLGDIIASVVLSLIDDVTTSEKVESLRNELIDNQPIGFPNLLSEEYTKLISKDSLKDFTKTISRSTSVYPKWLSRNEKEWSRIEEQGFAAEERVRQQFNFIMRRNRYYVELGEQAAKEAPKIDKAREIINNDLELGNNSPSTDKLVKIWKETFSSNQETPTSQGLFGQYWNQGNTAGAASPFGQGTAVDFGGYGNFDEFINELLGRFGGGVSSNGFSSNAAGPYQ